MYSCMHAYIEDGKADRDHQEPQPADAAAVNLKLVAEFHVLHAHPVLLGDTEEEIEAIVAALFGI